MPRLTSKQPQAAIEAGQRGARAAREIDPADREILDLAYMGRDPDEATIRRLLADETARDYARGTLRRLERKLAR